MDVTNFAAEPSYAGVGPAVRATTYATAEEERATRLRKGVLAAPILGAPPALDGSAGRLITGLPGAVSCAGSAAPITPALCRVAAGFIATAIATVATPTSTQHRALRRMVRPVALSPTIAPSGCPDAGAF